MHRQEYVHEILRGADCAERPEGRAFAPVNIALCKYWGKRDEELNLPQCSSLSVSLGPLGTETAVRRAEAGATEDRVELNGASVDAATPFARRLSAFLDLFRPDPGMRFEVRTKNTVPTAAGLASSASGFAALTLALDRLFGWNLAGAALSQLARLGSGSAARSVFDGFVLWHAGSDPGGADCRAERLPEVWPELRVGILTVCAEAKETGSTGGMNRTAASSVLFRQWPERCRADLESLRGAICADDFTRFGATAEANAMSMHATMLDARPPLLYWRAGTVAALHGVRELRDAGTEVYATIDAGPNVKLLFRERDEAGVRGRFPEMDVIAPFRQPRNDSCSPR